MPAAPPSSPDLTAHLGQFGLAVLKRLSSPLRAFAWAKVGLFGAFNLGLLSLKFAAEQGAAPRLSVEIAESSMAQIAVCATLVVLLLLGNLIAFLRNARSREAAQQRILDLLADPRVPPDIKRELLSRLD